MHEVGLAEDLLNQIGARLSPSGTERGITVRVRCGAAISEDALRQAFTMLTAGTRLEEAALIVEAQQDWLCDACGEWSPGSSIDAAAPVVMCPKCSALHPHGIGEDVELLDVTWEGRGATP